MKKFFLISLIYLTITTNLFPQVNRWVQKTSPPNPVSCTLSFSIGQYGYWGRCDNSPDLWQYDPKSDTWSQKKDLPFSNHSAYFTIDTVGYVISDNQFWAYFPESDKWVQKADYPGTKNNEGYSSVIGSTGFSFVIDKCGYVGMGLGPGGIQVKEHWEYNANTDSWRPRAIYPGEGNLSDQGRFTPVSFALNKKGYVGMGVIALGYPYLGSDLFQYDPALDSWTQKSSIPATGRYAASGFSIGNKGYVLGGERGNPTSNLDEFWQYDDLTDSWKKLEDFGGGADNYLKSFVIDNTVFSGKSTFWSFEPKKVTSCLPDYVPTDGLVGYWPFCGNANDESGNGNDGVVNGATLKEDRFGEVNNSFNFDGLSNYIELPLLSEINNLSQFSFSMWLKSDFKFDELYRTAFAHWITSAGGSGPVGLQIAIGGQGTINQGGIGSALVVGTGSWSNDNILLPNSWDQVLIIFDGNKIEPKQRLQIYINGVFQGYFGDSSIPKSTGNSSEKTVIGASVGPVGTNKVYNHFKGSLDDIGIWNRALTEAEIKALYEGTTPADSPLTLSIDTITGRRGDVVVLPVRVNNFNDILSGQMSVTFDPAIVTLAGVDNFGTDSITQASFNLADAASGRLSFLWTQNDNIPISLSDGDTLFAMRFKVLGRNTEFTDVRFATSPVDIEFVDASLNAVDNIVLQNGRINAFSENLLSGQLRTETGQGIRSATLAASGGSNASTTSALSGQYAFTLPELTSIKVTPAKANDTIVTNGITIADVIRMQRHILGSVPLESPYKIIAADVNQSGTITGLDVVLVNALILGRLSTYPGGKLWSFVPTSHTFANPQQPFPYPNYRSYTDFGGAANADFIGMKLGDVDNSYIPSQGRNPSSDTVTIYTEDQQVPAGAAEVRVPVRVSDFESISGFQFGVQWDPTVLKYKGAEKAAAMSAADLGTDHTENGHLNVAWFHPTGLWTTLSDGAAIMELIFETVGAPGSTSTVGVYDSPTTPVEVIQDDLSPAGAKINTGIIALGTPSSAQDAGAEGAQVSMYPNPFSNELYIEIQSALISETGMLSVYDETGRQVYHEEVRIEKGVSRHNTGAGLPAGSYTLRLEDRDGRIIKQQKAIKIR